MSDTSKCKNPIKKPQKAVEEKTDLQLLENNNDYHRRNVFKWFLLSVFIIVIFCVVIVFLWKFFTVERVQKFILDQILNNIVFILLSIFAILKINVPNIKN